MLHSSFPRAFLRSVGVLGLATVIAGLAGAQWSATFHSMTGADDQGYLVEVLSNGKVWMVGTGPQSAGSTDTNIRYTRYTAAGALQFSGSWTGSGNKGDVPSDTTIDAADNFYVVGASVGSGTGEDIITIKFNGAGKRLWARRYTRNGLAHDFGKADAVDASGNVYVAGYTQNAATGRDYTTLKYDPAGNRLWVRRYSSTGNNEDVPTGIALDASVGVYVTGVSNEDMATLKYSSTGDLEWSKRYDAGAADGAVALGVDPAGNPVVGGSSVSEAFSTDFVVAKYDRNTGVLIWLSRFGASTKEEIASAMAVDNVGNVVITGAAGFDVERMNYVTVKYDNAGIRLWVRGYTAHKEFGGSTDVAKAVVVDPAGNVYVTGTTQGDGITFDYNITTIKYTPGGAVGWLQTYTGPAGADATSSDIVFRDGSVVVTGTVVNGSNANDAVTIKY